VAEDNGLGREARLWEDTIVVALRDLQWMAASRQSGGAFAVPSPFLKLDGNAESRIGDTPYRMDERYFIFEVKPELGQVEGEWWRKSVFNPKPVYRRLRALVDNLNATEASTLPEDVNMFLDAMDMLQMSARGHHFICWNGQRGSTAGFIDMLPYVEGIASQTPEDIIDHHHVLPRPNINGPLTLRYGKKGGTPVSAAGLAMLLDHDHIVGEALSGRVETFGGLGLTRDEFQEYINFLCADAPGRAEPINAIVLSTDGTFFRLAGTTATLASMLDPQFKPAKKFEKVRRARARPLQRDLRRHLAESPGAAAQRSVAEAPARPWHARRSRS
jgi:hypothetical protein